MADINVTLNGGAAYSVPIDTTLKQAGAAADAAAVGAAIGECATQADLFDVERGLQADMDNVSAAVTTLTGEGEGGVKQMIADALELYRSTILDAAHPVGSIWISVTDDDPSTLFGGEWERIEDCMLMGSGLDYELGTTGGAAEHKHTTGAVALTVEQLPGHDHGARRIMGAFGLTDSQQLQRLKADTAQDFVVCPELTDSETGEPMTNVLSKGYMHAEGSQVKRYYSGHTALASAVHTGADAVVMDATHTHDAVGGGAAHGHGDTGNASSLPPYVTVAIWKRVA